ncbi:RNA-directed DNA polymerase from mobile element jockey [Elysia marginata]|uniref:RNA-directed DNA polymerase from mobile element jockey n=1 Tax=Elysia marginata TaxID=1093978 RepID=A0AAV4H5M0_9GAST|nr:RNA-directed DNA polymerase from mobile element jockey [Elysia marginata]
MTIGNYSLHDIEIKHLCLSDHSIISFVTYVSKPKCDEQSVTSRNVSQIIPIDFKNKLSSILSKEPPRNIDSLISALSTLLEDAAPMRRRTMKPRPPAPWLTPQVKAAKQERRKAERQWKKTVGKTEIANQEGKSSERSKSNNEKDQNALYVAQSLSYRVLTVVPIYGRRLFALHFTIDFKTSHSFPPSFLSLFCFFLSFSSGVFKARFVRPSAERVLLTPARRRLVLSA